MKGFVLRIVRVVLMSVRMEGPVILQMGPVNLHLVLNVALHMRIKSPVQVVIAIREQGVLNVVNQLVQVAIVQKIVRRVISIPVHLGIHYQEQNAHDILVLMGDHYLDQHVIIISKMKILLFICFIKQYRV